MGLVHAPSLLFLDEPSTGLDPQNRANLWEHILQMRASAATPMTIMLTTHYLDEADSMAGRVVVVDHGEVIADDTAEALKADLAGDRIVVGVEPESAAGPPSSPTMVGNLPGARDVTVDGAEVTGRVAEGPRALPELLRAAHQAGITVGTAQVHRPTLDDVFLTLTGRSLREAESNSARDADRPEPDGRTQHEHRRTATSPSHPARPIRPATCCPGHRHLVMTRELRPVLHDPFSLVFGMIQPLVFLALFGPLLVGSLGGQADTRSAAASGSGSCRRSW